MSSSEYTVKLLIDNKRGTVLLAEADEKFVDALGAELRDMNTLFDLLRQTLPASSSLANLCNSYHNLYQEPFDSGEVYCCLSCFRNFRFYVGDLACPACREKMFEIPSYVESQQTLPEGTYMITDDLEIKPMSTLSALNHMFTRLSVDGVDALEEKVVQLSRDEVTKLVRTSLQSKKILTDFFLNKADAEARTEADSEAEAVDGVKKEEFVVVDLDEAERPALDKIKFI